MKKRTPLEITSIEFPSTPMPATAEFLETVCGWSPTVYGTSFTSLMGGGVDVGIQGDADDRRLRVAVVIQLGGLKPVAVIGAVPGFYKAQAREGIPSQIAARVLLPGDKFRVAIGAQRLRRDIGGGKAQAQVGIELAAERLRDDFADRGRQAAEAAARTVSASNLLKCAVAGNDPNWGRVLSAVGTTDAEFDPDELDVSINGVMVCRGGMIGDPREGVDLASSRKVEVVVDLKAGAHEATIWTNDLTHDYVEENSAYSS